MHPLTPCRIRVVLAIALFAVPASAAAQGGCGGREVYRRLDFWVGEWEVFVGERRVGTNRIEKILGGCALVEHWSDARGGEGRSLFFVEPASGRWRQVWVTDRPDAPGGFKEKEMVDPPPGAGVRFQGEIALPGGGSYLDRTTLTPLPGGRVRQLIEVSGDGGATWEPRFDAVYVPG